MNQSETANLFANDYERATLPTAMLHQTDSAYLKKVAYQDADGLDIRNDILDQYRSQHRQGWYEWLFERLALPTEGRILDLGCGPADLWVKNRPRLAAAWHIYLSDFSAGMVQEARERLDLCSRPQSASFQFVQFNSTQIPFPNHTWDVVLALGLLDHLPDRTQALTEIKRVLKPGGIFCATAGGRDHLRELQALITPFLPDVNLGGDPQQFGLHNGVELLSPYFAAIEQHSYQDELIFNEPEPLIAFVLSEADVREQMTPATRHTWQRFIEARLAQEEIKVTTEKGLFIATS